MPILRKTLLTLVNDGIAILRTPYFTSENLDAILLYCSFRQVRLSPCKSQARHQIDFPVGLRDH